MELQLFLKNNLAFHFYYHQDNYSKGKVKVKNLYLLIPGLPPVCYQIFFREVIKKDRVFFSVYYYGSWFSGDKFTFSNCQKTLKDFIKFVQEKKGLKTYDQKIIR